MANESIAQCDVCRKWVKRSTIRLMAHDLLQLPAANYLKWSEYNTADMDGLNPNPYWAIDTSTLLSSVSLGVNGDARFKVNNDYDPATPSTAETMTYLNCATTFMSSGTVRTRVAVDVSAWTRVCFWTNVGMHERDAHQSMTVAMGTCDSDGANQQEWYTHTGIGRAQRWFSVPVSSITSVALDAVCFYVTVTVTNEYDAGPPEVVGCWWWIEESAANDLTVPGHFVRTKGAAISYATDTSIRTVARTCPNCREKLFKKSEARGRPNIQHDPPISRDVWEG